MGTDEEFRRLGGNREREEIRRRSGDRSGREDGPPAKKLSLGRGVFARLSGMSQRGSERAVNGHSESRSRPSRREEEELGHSGRKRKIVLHKGESGNEDNSSPPGRRGVMRARLGGKEPERRRSFISDDTAEQQDLEAGELLSPAPRPAVLSAVARVGGSDASSRAEAAALAGSDRESRARNRRMFGALLGTLQSFKKDEAKQRDKEEQRQAVEKKLEQKGLKEQERLREEKRRMWEQRRERQLHIRRLADHAQRTKEHEEWASYQAILCKFVRTAANPPIFWLPAKNSQASDKLIKSTAEDINQDVEERRVHLDEELQQLLKEGEHYKAMSDSKQEVAEGDDDEFDDGYDDRDQVRPTGPGKGGYAGNSSPAAADGVSSPVVSPAGRMVVQVGGSAGGSSGRRVVEVINNDCNDVGATNKHKRRRDSDTDMSKEDRQRQITDITDLTIKVEQTNDSSSAVSRKIVVEKVDKEEVASKKRKSDDARKDELDDEVSQMRRRIVEKARKLAVDTKEKKSKHKDESPKKKDKQAKSNTKKDWPGLAKKTIDIVTADEKKSVAKSSDVASENTEVSVKLSTNAKEIEKNISNIELQDENSADCELDETSILAKELVFGDEEEHENKIEHQVVAHVQANESVVDETENDSAGSKTVESEEVTPLTEDDSMHNATATLQLTLDPAEEAMMDMDAFDDVKQPKSASEDKREPSSSKASRREKKPKEDITASNKDARSKGRVDSSTSKSDSKNKNELSREKKFNSEAINVTDKIVSDEKLNSIGENASYKTNKEKTSIKTAEAKSKDSNRYLCKFGYEKESSNSSKTVEGFTKKELTVNQLFQDSKSANKDTKISTKRKIESLKESKITDSDKSEKDAKGKHKYEDSKQISKALESKASRNVEHTRPEDKKKDLIRSADNDTLLDTATLGGDKSGKQGLSPDKTKKRLGQQKNADKNLELEVSSVESSSGNTGKKSQKTSVEMKAEVINMSKNEHDSNKVKGRGESTDKNKRRDYKTSHKDIEESKDSASSDSDDSASSDDSDSSSSDSEDSSTSSDSSSDTSSASGSGSEENSYSRNAKNTAKRTAKAKKESTSKSSEKTKKVESASESKDVRKRLHSEESKKDKTKLDDDRRKHSHSNERSRRKESSSGSSSSESDSDNEEVLNKMRNPSIKHSSGKRQQSKESPSSSRKYSKDIKRSKEDRKDDANRRRDSESAKRVDRPDKRR